MGLQRSKWYCVTCDWAAKGPCPQHPATSLRMGAIWRPGKKGRRTRLWDNRVHGSVTAGQLRERYAWNGRGYNAHPLPRRVPPPAGLRALGAVDFSYGANTPEYDDPVRAGIRAKRGKPEMKHLMQLACGESGWPFPYRWH